jgi:hypothetical protein
MDHQKDQIVHNSMVHGGFHHIFSRNERSTQFPSLNSKGKKPIDLDKASTTLLGCNICSRSRLRSPPCRDWIRCHSCRQRGHVAHHCAAKWKKSGDKDGNQAIPNHMPIVSAKNISPTLRHIWVAKAKTAGGASGSKHPILDALIDSSRDTGEEYVSTELGLGTVHRNCSHSLEELSLHLSSSLSAQTSTQVHKMAFQRADQRACALPGFHHQEVHHRATMAHAVMRPPPRVHEDYVIVSITPILNHHLLFSIVQEVVEEFLVERMHIGIRDIQPSHLGHALVRFENIFDRDLLVNNSPHPYGGVNFTLVRHNAARN